MRILIWHVHGAWTTAFVQGPHTYLVPVMPDRGPDGRGRAETYAWPGSVREIAPEDLRRAEVDVVVLQRRHEWELAEHWLGRRLGRDVPAVYVEHNTPREDTVDTRHPMADRGDVTLVHVTHFNDLFWYAGSTRTAVIEHGIAEPAVRFGGDVPHLAAVMNEPVRRGRITGTDLLPHFTGIALLDLFGIGVRRLAGPRLYPHEDVPQDQMHAALATRTMIDNHLRTLSAALNDFAASADLDVWGDELADVLVKRGGKLIAAGNGGSAAHAQHIVTELVGRMKDERQPLSALALTADGTTVTALGNDDGFDEVFARQVAAHARPGDVVLLLSTSGGSANVLRAAEVAAEQGADVWSFTGRHPNPLSLHSKHFLAVDSDDGQIVQEVHQVAVHLLCACLDRSLKAPADPPARFIVNAQAGEYAQSFASYETGSAA